MEPVRLGRSGLKVSPLALGTAAFGDPSLRAWNLGEEAASSLVAAAFDRGVTLFDTGSTYGGGLAETRLGAALARLGHRHDVTITTKIFFPTGPGPNERGLSRQHLTNVLDRSLKRLGTDFVDLLMIHRFDSGTPIEETLATLEHFVRSGRVRYLGASSMSAWRLMKMLSLQDSQGFSPFIAMQGHYNLVYREEEREMIPLCREEGLGYMAWSPLARGRLAGPQADITRLQGDPLARASFDPALDRPALDALSVLAAATGLGQAELSLAWLAGKGVIPVIGPSGIEQLDRAIAGVRLAKEELSFASVESAYLPHAVIGFDPKAESASAPDS